MLKRTVVMAMLALCTARPGFAQEPKVEVGVNIGWVFSDGVSGSNFLAPDGNIYNRVDPKDSFGWGFNVGALIGPNAEVGFIYGMQPSTLQVSGTSTKDVGDMKINTYHGYFAYNWGDPGAKIRPYFLGGFGASNFGQVNYTSVTGVARTINSSTRFSSTWGAGVKIHGNSNVGGRFGIRWTPAYIKSDSEGYWCDPYWGCYLVGSAQYSNQFDLNGGVIFRF
jgi:opacity protein-like surface antigen